MSRRLMRISLALVFFLSSEVWAIGLGDINLDSALNEPLRAQIELLSATPEELENLTVTLASADTFERYGIDRPFYLQGLQFNVASGAEGAVVQVRSRAPITEPFLTFLVEATWSSGRLLREYTVLLDPPTYMPPAVQQAPAVEAPRRATPTDSARIERQPPAPQPEPEPQAQPEPRPIYTPPPRPVEQPAAQQPTPAPSYSEPGYSTAAGGDYYVERGDTLWGIASRMRPDSRLAMNQTMLAIFEANPEAFAGNINRLKAGASLSIPSADDVFQISRSDAFTEVKRQNEAWRGSAALTPDTSYADTTVDEPAYDEPVLDEPDYTTTTPAEAEPAPAETQPSLVLVPPDEEPAGAEYADELETAEAATREQAVEQRIAELEAADVPDQQSLIEIRDNELAALRQELAEIRGEIVAEPIDESLGIPSADDEIVAETDAEAEQAAADAAADEAAAEAETPPAPVVQTRRVSEPSIMDRVMAILGSFWTKIIAALILVAGVLLWFVRRGRDDEEDTPWETLDSDEIAAGAMAATATLSAPSPEEAFVVVEQDSGIRPLDDDTLEAPMPEAADDTSATADTGTFGSLEDTFSSETAVNLDQSDPLAEADFHMAYGLYDQAADLINGALEADPADQALMSKLCEIYFVWGNRDAFVDAATNLKAAVGDGESAEWDKIVIMGQQIAADHALFAGAAVAGATKAVDLSFESDMDEAGALDIDFGGGDDAGASDVVDLGAEDAGGGDDAVDFFFDEEVAAEPAVDEMLEATAESPTVEQPGEIDMDVTAEMPAPAEPTVETPTIEDQFSGLEGTSELPSLDESLGSAIADAGQDAEATAEINLDELGLDVDGLAETEVAELSDLDETGTNEILEDLADITGKNPEVDPDSTGVHAAPDAGSQDFGEGLDFDDLGSSGTGLRLAPDETGRMPLMDSEAEADAETDTAIDPGLLDATGVTQVLSDDLAVETTSDVEAGIGDDEATMLAPGYGDDEDTEVSGDAETLLAPLDDDDEDFDFAKTEALPPEAFTGETNLDETGEMPVAGTDLDLDLDDLTAALQVSEVGDTVEQLRDDATVEQPRPSVGEETAEIPTMSLGPEDMSEDLHEARTMTEVGTKLDLARAYVDMGDPAGARSILEEVLDEGDEGQRQQAQQLLDSLPG
ncbi:MAG: LysM peptidoglycan-binding domain-containing protein [Gammaproteobacteria bacterium]|nr:LysM peptidoglycan-binding domain-containing protein [Gammaproteobacteria bacterium]